MSTQKFSTLPLSADFIANLGTLGYETMTAIQAESLPAIMDGKDVLAQAKTGSGKTAAFGIGLLHKLNIQKYKTQALIICPTRELADQVSKELRRLARQMPNTKITTLCGGVSIGPQIGSLERAPHIVVGTPGRLLKHLQKDTLNLDYATMLVLDEADRMLDMGFHDDIMSIIKLMRNQAYPRQTLLFSATYPDEIRRISKAIQKNPLDIQVESLHNNSQIQQTFFEIERGMKSNALVKLLNHYRPESSIVFCNRKDQCRDVAEELWDQGFHALALHGDLDQKERDRVLVQFSNKSSSVLIATDVAARGLDIKDLSAVINYELPHDPEIHIHRIGRTGRAGNEGLALSLFHASEARKVNAIEEYQKGHVKTASIDGLVSENPTKKLIPPMTTLCISGGRKDKVRPGDLLGALTAKDVIPGKRIGKIDIFSNVAYVAVEHPIANQALDILSNGNIKGRQFNVRRLR